MQQKSYFSILINCLKKIVAIFLLFVFLLNMVGYQYYIGYLQKKADNALEKLIDNNEYSESQLIEMRVSLNMPYQHRFTEFERHYGEINIDGKIYTYVKRKIEGDVLILKCIPNQQKDLLKEKSNDLTKSNSGNSGETHKKATNTNSGFSADYDDNTYFFQTAVAPSSKIKHADHACTAITDGFLRTLQQPPDTIC